MSRIYPGRELLRSVLREILREVLREEFRRLYDNVVSYSGFRFRILFYRYRYTPHYAEHVIDPRDGREKLVLAIPHTTPKQGTIVIYDLLRDEIEWEFQFPQPFAVSNPHMAHMVADINPVTGSWLDVAGRIGAEPGDIVAPATDNTWVVIDRDTKRVKSKIKPQFNAKWVHDIVPSKDGSNLIVTDYSAGVTAKIRPDGSAVWIRTFGNCSKISVIESSVSGHNMSYGGDYIVVRNVDTAGVHEIRDGDGRDAWYCGALVDGTNVFWTFRPHSAFRIGEIENDGSLTVIGFEAGGGIVAVDRNCRPRWGIMKPYLQGIYRPASFGLGETTHVFPTLRGTIGFVDWMGKYASLVGEILEIPYHQTLIWFLAHDHDPGDNGTYYDPLLEISEWQTVKIVFINFGGNPLDYVVYGTYVPYAPSPGLDFPSHWDTVASGTVDPGDRVTVDVSGYTMVRVFGKRHMSGAGSSWKIVVVQRR